ncbi:hypothetical protein H0H93_015511 [Arthromyces matolae]|nr:hypothetical protein H0H93_015511 [Arthromyces matolae]
MVGFGTKDKKLVYRIVRAHWDPNRLNAVKGAYQSRTGKTLEDRVKKETSGDYEKLMLTLLKGQTPVAGAGKVQAHGHGH